jgi:signal transduction histidine kinase
VSVSSSPGSATVSVQDHGPGLPAAEQARVFERFYRGDKSRARQGDVGAGLGLSIAQTLVEAHDGHITLTSSPGQGTTVSFTLPVE